jgi:UPF0042 nucleotide-binding protein
MSRRRPAAGPSARGVLKSGPRFVVVTGLSGAGKSHAMRALEDAGYSCVDNLPVALITTFADLTLANKGRMPRAAVGVDVREGAALPAFPSIYRRLKRRKELGTQLLFLEAEERVLLRRYSETRRPHPLARNRSAAEGLRDERRALEPIRRLADRILETSRLSVHELRRRVVEIVGFGRRAAPLSVHLVSFGFRHGLPSDADLVFDVRFLPNPHFVDALRPLSGLAPRAARYVMRAPGAQRFLRLTWALLSFLLPQYIAEGKAYVTIAIGCTGGRHRSVAIAEALAERARALKGVDVRVRHRDIAESA